MEGQTSRRIKFPNQILEMILQFKGTNELVND